MKARIKATGEVVEVEYQPNAPFDCFWKEVNKDIYYGTECLDFNVFMEDPAKTITDQIEANIKLIDWEQRTWDAAVAIMAAMLSNEELRVAMLHDRANCAPKLTIEEYNASMAIEQAKALVAEYRKGE